MVGQLSDLQDYLSARPPRAASLEGGSCFGKWISAVDQALDPPLRQQRRDLFQVIPVCADEHQMCAGFATKRRKTNNTYDK